MEAREDFLKPVPDKEKSGWKATVTDRKGDQVDLETVALTSRNARMGVEVSYGQRPEGYDGWVIREPNGGVL